MLRLPDQGAASGILAISCGILAVPEGDRHVTWLYHDYSLFIWKGLLRLLDQLFFKKKPLHARILKILKICTEIWKMPTSLVFKQGVFILP